MLKTNEYFDGKVKSIALNSADGAATIGVMEKGEYEFGTSSKEIMEVVSGVMKVTLPGESSVKTVSKGETFEVEKDSKFRVVAEEESAYICYYK